MIEQNKCHAYARHLAACKHCLSGYRKPPGTFGLCDEGKQLRDVHIVAARSYAEVDAKFAQRHASLICSCAQRKEVV